MKPDDLERLRKKRKSMKRKPRVAKRVKKQKATWVEKNLVSMYGVNDDKDS